MRNDCYYVSSRGTVFNFQIENRRMNRGTLRDYEWEHTDEYNRVRVFTRSLTSRTANIFFLRRSGVDNDLQNTAERFYRIIDEDVRRLQQGKLYYNDYYIKCYIIGSKKDNYDSGVVIGEEVTILSDFVWRKDITKVISRQAAQEASGTGIDYPYDYEYDYAADYDYRRFVNGAIAPYDFTIVFGGKTAGWTRNPQIIVNGHIYRVFVELNGGETLTVDSLNKTIIRTKADGTKVNEFDNRDRNNYIFKKMEEVDGISTVEIEEFLTAVLTAHIERSEPTWI